MSDFASLQPFDPMHLTDEHRANLDKLVDQDAVTQADAAHAAAITRRDTVQVEYNAAKQAADTATTAYEGALNGKSDVPVMDAFRAMEEAVRVRDVTGEVLNRTCQVLDKLEQGLNAARGIGWRPVYLEGVKARLAAAKKADTARALLAEAADDYLRASQIILHARANGAAHAVAHEVFNTNLEPHTTELREKQLWSSGHGWAIDLSEVTQ